MHSFAIYPQFSSFAQPTEQMSAAKPEMVVA
jgi:hypothetical protein